MDPSQSQQQQQQQNGSGHALAILSRAAIQTRNSSASTRFHYEPPPTTSSQTDAQTPLTPITSHFNGHQPLLQHSDVTQLRTDIPHSSPPVAAQSQSHSMDVLAYASSRSRDTLNPYIADSYEYRGGTPQTSMTYAHDLGILNAETYDDGRLTRASHDARMSRSSHEENFVVPFGLTRPLEPTASRETKTGSSDVEKGTKRKKKHSNRMHNEDDEEEARKRARGRPRVDTKDETAADRRRTQIRMAQRAYRNRKETTISSLEKQVHDLRSTNEEMSNIFKALSEFAISRGLLEREPEFGQLLQSTSHKLLALTKATPIEDGSHDENVPATEHESGNHPTSISRSSLQQVQESKNAVNEPVQPYGAYTLTKDESPIEEVSRNTQQHQYEDRDLQALTRTTENNIEFPFEMMELQQYHVELPSAEAFSQNFFPQSQPSLPATGSQIEFSFARRIHRGALEKALLLLTSPNPPREHYQKAFGFCMLYESKEEVEARVRRRLASSSRETLQEWRAPFVHIGGAGTFYPMHESDVELMPKFRTGYSMGPFSPIVSEVGESILDGIRCNIPGFEGEFFDANDVEGYLRGRGLEIPPTADFVTAELDVSVWAEISIPKSSSSDSDTAPMSPDTPASPVDKILDNADYFDFNKSDGKNFSFPMVETQWNSDNITKDTGDINSAFSTIPDLIYSERIAEPTSFPNVPKRRVTINVQILVEELLNRGVCLGRAPGFKLSDVNASIVASIKAEN